MKLSSAFKELTFINNVESKRKEYFIYKSRDLFVIVSEKNESSGYYAFVDGSLVNRIYDKFHGKKSVTTNLVSKHGKKYALGKQLSKKPFGVLHCLYVLVALRKAKIDKRHTKGNSLYFNIH